MTQAWEEYGSLERSVEQLRAALQAQQGHGAAPQVRAGAALSHRLSQRSNASRSRPQQSELKRELWRIEDVLAGLSASKANFRITIDSVQNPGEFLGRRSEVGGLWVCTNGFFSSGLRPTERKFVPLTSDLTVPSQKLEAPPPAGSSHFLAIAPHSSATPTSVSSSALRLLFFLLLPLRGDYSKRSSARGRSSAQAAAAPFL